MLVDFTVRNYRSIRDEQRLSLVATSSSDKEETQIFDSGAPGVDRLLRSAVIYGANAAGKSNFLRGLGAMKTMVVTSSGRQVGDTLPIEPFLLDGSSGAETTFEVVMIVDRVKYQYGFSANSSEVVEEWLYAFPEKRAQKWFHRDRSVDPIGWFGSHLKGSKQSWAAACRPNALLLATAVQLNSEQLRPIYEWFKEKLQLVLGTGELSESFTAKLMADQAQRARLSKLLRAFDTGIEDMRLEQTTPSEEWLAAMRKVIPEAMQEDLLEHAQRTVRFRHSSKTGSEIWLDLDDESQGTQKLFAYAGPILDVIDNGLVLVIDEMNNSLHPLIVRKIVEMFHDPRLNSKNAQLLFASHATSVLSSDLFRRDQVWFVEKDASGSSALYPLTDFSPRKDASLAKGYLQGKFGAIPYLGSDLLYGT